MLEKSKTEGALNIFGLLVKILGFKEKHQYKTQ